MTDELTSDETPEQPLSIDEQVAQLRAELTALQEHVDAVTTVTVHENSDGTATPAPTPVSVEAAQVAQAADIPAPGMTARTGRAWRTMTAEQAGEAWRTLFDFVDWMTYRYDLHDTLPSCWWRHGAFVEELHALQLAWVGAYLHPKARPTDPTSWHELQHRALTRLREADRLGCIAGTHRDPPSSQRDAVADELVARAAYADADTHQRPRATPGAVPEPPEHPS